MEVNVINAGKKPIEGKKAKNIPPTKTGMGKSSTKRGESRKI